MYKYYKIGDVCFKVDQNNLKRMTQAQRALAESILGTEIISKKEFQIYRLKQKLQNA